MSINKFNSEGYYDPTAYEAMSAVEKEEKALRAFRPIVYICSPYAGEVEKNVAAAQSYSRFAVDKGYIPVAPHLLFPQFLNDSNPKEPSAGAVFRECPYEQMLPRFGCLVTAFRPAWRQKSAEPSGKTTACATLPILARRYKPCLPFTVQIT